MLHFKNTSSDKSLSDILALFGRSTMPPWLKTLSTGALEARMANVWHTAGISLSYLALLRTQKSTGSESQSPSISLHVSIWLKARPLKHQSQCHCHKWRIGVVFTPIYIDLVGTKDLKKGLAGIASKSKSKSSKNGLKSRLESKSGLEYYKSAGRPCRFYCWSENRTVQNRNCGFFLKTEPKLTDLGHCETVTSLIFLRCY